MESNCEALFKLVYQLAMKDYMITGRMLYVSTYIDEAKTIIRNKKLNRIYGKIQ
jgi:hypothetical protein